MSEVVGKGRCTFKQTDLTRALRAVTKAGVESQVKIDLERKTMTITPVKVSESDGKTENEWDEVLPNGERPKIS